MDAPRLLHPDQALDEQLRLLASLRDPQHTARRMRAYADRVEPLGGLRPWQYAEFLGDLTKLMARAEPVLWSNEMWTLGNRAAETYPAAGVCWAPDMWLAPVQYWAYETDCMLDEHPALLGAGFTGSFSNLTAGVDGLVLDVAFLVLPGEPFLPMVALHRQGEAVEGTGVYLAAKLDFMRSTVVASAHQAAGRGARKRWQKATATVAPLVRVVALRRRRTAGESEAEHAEREWSCRWIVGGHWRNQYLPASGSHRPTWIAPYLKGPDEKPLRTPAARVWSVVR